MLGQFAALVMMGSASSFEVWLDRRGSSAPLARSLPRTLFDRVLTLDTATDTSLESLIVTDSKLVGSGGLMGACLSIGEPAAQQEALALIGSVQWLFIEASHAPMITAENIIALSGGTPTRLAMAVSHASDVNGLAFALQIGVDALVATEECCAEDAALLEALQIAKAQRLESVDSSAPSSVSDESATTLTRATITDISPGGVGDRVCLDFTRLLDEGEGCLVGSSAKLLALVLGETAPSGFVPPRPFRCNAGPVHSYVMLADGSTKYLSEVVAGEELLIVRNPDGRTRPMAIGRCKCEPRPLLKVAFELPHGASNRGQIFLQQAETVRLGRAVGGGVSVTRAKPGDAITIRATGRGTHVGRAIAAQVTER